VLTGSIGLLVAIVPLLWLDLFSHDPEVLRLGATYLRIVAPAYAALGFSFVVAFATQGADRVFWPFIGSLTRIVVAAGLGWIAVGYFGAGMTALASMVAASLVVYAAICVIAMNSRKVWGLDKT
jgi:Na+-driven multidrug efflux pump